MAACILPPPPPLPPGTPQMRRPHLPASKKVWTHNELASDLAAHLRAITDRLVWENMQMGPAGSPRPDVYSVPKSYTRFTPLAYEVKISVSDFRRDVTKGKWQSYLNFAVGVTFAAPAGLITKADIPPGCGLMVRGEDGWRTLKAPTLARLETLSRDAWMKLLIDGVTRSFGKAPEPRSANEWEMQKNVRRVFGEQIANLLSDHSKAEQRIKHATYMAEVELQNIKERTSHSIERARLEAKRSADQIDAERMLLCEVLGLEPDSKAWEIAQALAAARRRVDLDQEVSRLRRKLDRIRTLTNHMEVE